MRSSESGYESPCLVGNGIGGARAVGLAPVPPALAVS